MGESDFNNMVAMNRAQRRKLKKLNKQKTFTWESEDSRLKIEVKDSLNESKKRLILFK